MSRFFKQRSQKAGLPPGSLIHIGERLEGKPEIKLIDYDPDHYEEKAIGALQECFPFRDRPTVTWIDIEGLDQAVLQPLGDCYGIHPLIQEDILNTDQRPKADDMEEYIFLVLKMLDIDDRENLIKAEQVSIIFGSNFLISFQEGFKGDTFDEVRRRLRNGKGGRMRKLGSDYLAYALIDGIIDRYFAILEKLGDQLEELEEELVDDPTAESMRRIHHLKREILYLRRSVWPLRELLGMLEKSESPLIQESTHIFFRDIHDHVVQIIDTIETFREMLSGMLDIYLSSLSNRMNQVMKVLTIIATLFIPLTFIAGVYGMNFKFMPELNWRWGYPLVWGVIVSVATGLIVYFKKKGWW